MSSLFDDSFLADLKPSAAHEEEPPPPPEDGTAEPLPDDLFGGRFDVPPSRSGSRSGEAGSGGGYYRDGAPRPVVDPATLLDGLNENQRAAVVHAGSPLLIVAGAGSGKTRVLTHRIAYLLGERHVHPGQILAITFTNKAAGEMKERVEQLVGPRANAMWVMTFHSACVRILRRESKKLGFTSSFSIYDA
ncbi:MAG: ATP-dependent helicase UvrD/PcrA, partial [Streptomyces sp.]|nr:ATP-dependent helicase UvrD/PcrA [Streptomyces sp.]